MTQTCYFLSDIHFADPRDPRCVRARRFLKSLEGKADTIYLVGDVFDFWLGYTSVIFSDFFLVFKVLSELVESGTRVVLFSGNHDPDPGHFFETLGIEVHESGQNIVIDGHPLWLEHGDIIDPRGRLRRGICRAARNRILRTFARFIHPDLAWWLSRFYARKEEKYDDPLPQGLADVFFEQKVSEGYTAVVLGHYHRAVHHEVIHGGGVKHFFVLGDWVQHFTFMRYQNDVFQLCRIIDDDLNWEVMPIGDHSPSGDTARQKTNKSAQT